MWTDGCVNLKLMGGVFSQPKYVSNRHVAQIKYPYLTIIFVNYISIKSWKNRKKKKKKTLTKMDFLTLPILVHWLFCLTF